MIVVLSEDIELEELDADDGYLRFSCPKCGRLIFRFHPAIHGAVHLKCTRKGLVSGGRSLCGWADYVYFNVQPEEVS